MANAINIGLSGLKAASSGIATASHNIANVGTEGFTRQRNISVTENPQLSASGYWGSGVTTGNIERIQDSYVAAQLQSQSAELGRVSTVSTMAQRIETLVAGSGIDAAQTEFFNSLEDAANNPHSVAQSNNVIEAGKNLASQYNYLDSQLDTIRSDVNKNIQAEVSEINNLSQGIYELNKQISTATVYSSGSPPNDLLDRRQELIKQLSTHVGTNTLNRGDHAIDVSTANGIPLVSIAGAHKLVSMPSSTNTMTQTVAIQTNQGNEEFSLLLSGGNLGGLIEFQNELLEPTRQHLGRSATVIAESFNSTFQAAVTDPDAKLFSITPAITHSNAHNIGTGTARATLLDTALMSTSDYTIDFDGAAYTLTRLTDGNSISGPASLSMDGIQFSVSAGAVAGDSYLVRPGGNAAATLSIDDSYAAQLSSLQPGANPVPVVEALAELRNVKLFDEQTATIGEQFSSLLIQVGSSVRTAINQEQSMQQIYNDTTARRDSVSGVSLDEEAAALLMYQRNYDASAKAIAVANTMFDTLMATINRI